VTRKLKPLIECSFDFFRPMFHPFLRKIDNSFVFEKSDFDRMFQPFFVGLLLEQAIRLNDEAALEVLFEYSNETFPVDRSKDWHAWGLAELVWKYQRALNQQNYAECQIVMEQLSLINATEASLKQAELLSAKDLMPKKALNLLNGMYAASRNGTAHVMDLMAFSTRLKLRILLLKSKQSGFYIA
jgi:hypothetical protein